MTNEERNTALYKKVFAEQEQYQEWLLSQPPNEILNHCYEYTVREDIVLALEEYDLSDKQCKALLKSPSPLADAPELFDGALSQVHSKTRYAQDALSRSAPQLRQLAAGQWRAAEANPGVARPLGFQHDRQYLRPSRLQIQNILGTGDGTRNASSEIR